MAKRGKKAQDKIEQVMHEYKQGDLTSGSGDPVENRDQAVAIALSEAREEGANIPESQSGNSGSGSSGSKRGRKSSGRKSAPKKAAKKASKTAKKT
ncbi:MAG TPA: DUF6496 domain-containing protein, partial [Saprospiraceae bacterium]|nr:DUF6496 domain-containing protein [Saprospiraceae bacterium]